MKKLICAVMALFFAANVSAASREELPVSLETLLEIWNGFYDGEVQLDAYLVYDVDEDGVPEVFLRGYGKYMCVVIEDGEARPAISVDPPASGQMVLWDDSMISIVEEYPHGQAEIWSFYKITASYEKLIGQNVTNRDVFSDDEEPKVTVGYTMLVDGEMVEVTEEDFEETFNPAIANVLVDDLPGWVTLDDED